MIRSICDLSDDHPALVRAVDPVFRDFGGIRVFHGRITTLRCHEDNMLLRRTLSTPGEGRVMVVDGGGSLRRALIGDKLGALLLQHGWAGIVVSAHAEPHPKVPAVEQWVAVGAAIQNLWLAAVEMGLGLAWKTGNPAYDPVVKEALGVPEGDAIIGFLHVGTPLATAPPRTPDAASRTRWL
jgi:RraA family protein